MYIVTGKIYDESGQTAVRSHSGSPHKNWNQYANVRATNMAQSETSGDSIIATLYEATLSITVCTAMFFNIKHPQHISANWLT